MALSAVIAYATPGQLGQEIGSCFPHYTLLGSETRDLPKRLIFRCWNVQHRSSEFRDIGAPMNTTIGYLFGVVITPWKLVGYLGVSLFAGRWVVQLIATRRHGRPVFPGAFWTMSVLGSALLLAYFIWGKNDSVGVLSNLFPMSVALYNLAMHRRSMSAPDPTAQTSGHHAGPNL